MVMAVILLIGTGLPMAGLPMGTTHQEEMGHLETALQVEGIFQETAVVVLHQWILSKEEKFHKKVEELRITEADLLQKIEEAVNQH